MLKASLKRYAAQALTALAFSTSAAFADVATPPLGDTDLSISVAGYLDEANVKAISQQITDLRAANPNEKIRIEIFDSIGGNIEYGFKLVQTIYEAGNIDLVCRGDIKSMTAVMFSSYQNGQRIAADDCKNMTYHDLITHIWSPTPGARLIRSQIVKDAESLTQAANIMSLGISQASAMPHESAKALFGADCHLSPDKAYSLGLFDAFEGRSKALPTKVTNPSAEQIYEACNTSPLMEGLQATDWSQYNFGIK